MFHFSEINSTNFTMSAEANFKRLNVQTGRGLRLHQEIIMRYAISGKTRGLLVYHTPGMGKTLPAAGIADYYRSQGRIVIFMAPLSLHENFKISMRKYYQMKKLDGYDENIKAIHFVSTNASNMFDQVAKVISKVNVTEVTDVLKPSDPPERFFLNLSNTALIVDECHDLANSITNLSSNASKFYGSVMKARDIKLLFLTGTPIINNPFEIVPLLNMIRGRMSNGQTLFPEYYEDFTNAFVGKDHNVINENVFLRRISGLVSYYGDLFTDSGKKSDFPEEKNLIIEKVPMSMEQFQNYSIYREKERRKEAESQMRKSGSKKDKHLAIYSRDSRKSAVSSSTYRIDSRQASNFYLPAGKSTKLQSIENFPEESLRLPALLEYSPKFAKALSNIEKHVAHGQLGVVYSEFVSGEGINLFSRTLQANGWEEVMLDTRGGLINELDSLGLLIQGGGDQPAAKKVLRFARITGEVDADQRSQIVQLFNSESNKNGADLMLLLISSTGAQGLSLHNVRHIHMMEPYWNISRLRQVIGRGVRYLSHKTLKPEDRNVQPYLYISTYPEKFPLKSIKEPTTDESIYKGAVDRETLAQQFRMLLVRGSIDCSIHASADFGCFKCQPTSAKLYEETLKDDLLRPETPDCSSSGTEQVKKQKRKVMKVDIDPDLGIYYFSKEDGAIQIFTYDESLHQYIELKPFQKNYAQVFRAIVENEKN